MTGFIWSKAPFLFVITTVSLFIHCRPMSSFKWLIKICTTGPLGGFEGVCWIGEGPLFSTPAQIVLNQSPHQHLGNLDVLLIPAVTQVLLMWENRLKLLADSKHKSSSKPKFLHTEDVGNISIWRTQIFPPQRIHWNWNYPSDHQMWLHSLGSNYSLIFPNPQIYNFSKVLCLSNYDVGTFFGHVQASISLSSPLKNFLDSPPTGSPWIVIVPIGTVVLWWVGDLSFLFFFFKLIN